MRFRFALLTFQTPQRRQLASAIGYGVMTSGITPPPQVGGGLLVSVSSVIYPILRYYAVILLSLLTIANICV